MIEELTEKYAGEFSKQRIKKNKISKIKYSHVIENGKIELGKSTLQIALYENNENSIIPYFYKLTLCLNENFNSDINIYPLDLWNQLLNKVFPKRKNFIPKKIRNQFWFNGDENLIKKVSTNFGFYENLNTEKVFIETYNREKTYLVLIPENGKMNKSQAEKFIEVLKIIESEIKNCTQQRI